jgi:hypothetical protein
MGNYVDPVSREIILIMGLLVYGNSTSRDLILSRGSRLRGTHLSCIIQAAGSHAGDGSLFGQKLEVIYCHEFSYYRRSLNW